MKMLPNLLILFLLFSVSNVVFGQFGPEKIVIEGPQYMRDGVLSDLDGDGDLDAIIATERILGAGKNEITWYENLGDGTFGKPNELIQESWFDLGRIQATDWDDDGDQDILFSGLPGSIWWFENLGDATFAEQEYLAIGGSVRALKLYDWDDDGDLDVFAAIYGGRFAWYEKLEGTALGDQQIIAEDGEGQMDIDIADLDGDGDPDVVGALYSTDEVVWYENLGDGDFATLQYVTDLLNGPRSVEAADFDGDGDMDVLCASSDDDQVTWMENTGDGTFNDPVVVATELFNAYDAHATDLDEDGDLDILAVANSNKQVYWYSNDGSGAFSEGALIATPRKPLKVFTGDVDNDGLEDVVTVAEGAKLIWNKNLGGATYATEKTISHNGSRVFSTATADPDHDGDVDVFVASDDHIAMYRNMGAGEFDVQEIISPFGSDAYGSIALADLNNDDEVDVLSVSFTGNNVVWFEGGGDGSFGPEQIISELTSEPQNIQAADLDADGDLDVFSASQGDNKIAWYENLGGGTFGTQQIIATSALKPQFLNIVDLDGDDDLDVLSASLEDDKIAWFENTGGGTFSPEQIISTEMYAARAVHAADLDGDGDLDVLSATTNILAEKKVVWFENLGDGTFAPEVVLLVPTYGTDYISTKDVDGDDDLDIFIALKSAGRLMWIENWGDGDFGPGTLISNDMAEAKEVHVVDIDGDTDLDVLGLSWGLQKVNWYPNLLVHPNQVRGELFIDNNENGIKDSDENGINLIEVVSDPESAFAFTYSSGKYFMNFPEDATGLHEVSVDLPEFWGITSDSATYHVVLDDDFVFLDSADFGLFPDTIVDKVVPDLTGGFPRCNSEVNYWVSLENQGSNISSGLIALTLDDSISYVDAPVAPDSIVGQIVYWHYDSLYYFETETFLVQVQMPDFMSMGDTLRSFLSVTAGETYKLDTLDQILLCAYDPNDKAATPAGIDSLGFISPEVSEIEYLIRFQNTGTDTALNIVIKDQLDTALNWLSFEPVASSHPVEVDFFPGGELTFTFEDIYLPDSNVNEPASHGFVKYRILLNEGLPLGTTIRNGARIYFDANPPIYTNVTLNTIFDCNYILDQAVLPAVVCHGDSITGKLPVFTSSSTVEWAIEGEVFDEDEVTWWPETPGEIEVGLTVASDFCSADTLLFVAYLPEIPVTYKDTLLVCNGDSVQVFDTYQSEENWYIDTLYSVDGCDSVLQQFLVVKPLPVAEFAALEDVYWCIDQGTIELAASPEGGSFSGAGVVENIFNPDLAGEGIHELYYHYADEFGCAATDSVAITVVNCLSVLENDIESWVSVYPNPSQNRLTINKPNKEEAVIVIRDMNGKICYQNNTVKTTEHSIDVSNWERGIYLLQVTAPSHNEPHIQLLVISKH